MDKRVVEYYLLTDNSKTEFQKWINERLIKGWHLYGSPFINEGDKDGYGRYAQAMVKYASDS